MTRLSPKHILLMLLFLTGSFAAPAQLNLGAITNNPLGLAVGVDGGATFSFTDVNKNNSSFVYGIHGSYDPLNWARIMLNIQNGRLTAGKKETNRRYFENNYWYGALTGRIYPARFAGSYEKGIRHVLSLAYLGAGISLLKSQSKPNPVTDPKSGYLHYYNGTDLLFPLEAGIDLPLLFLKDGTQSVSLNLNCRSHFSLSDKLDGYDPASRSNKSKDAFSQLTIGIAYSF